MVQTWCSLNNNVRKQWWCIRFDSSVLLMLNSVLPEVNIWMHQNGTHSLSVLLNSQWQTIKLVTDFFFVGLFVDLFLSLPFGCNLFIFRTTRRAKLHFVIVSGFYFMTNMNNVLAISLFISFFHRKCVAMHTRPEAEISENLDAKTQFDCQRNV